MIPLGTRFFVHQPAQANVSISREYDKVRVEINDFVGPTVITRLGMDADDMLERKNGLVAGSYELPVPRG